MSGKAIPEEAVAQVCDRMLTAAIGKDWRDRAPEAVTAFWMGEVREALQEVAPALTAAQQQQQWQGGGEVVAWRVPVVQSPFGEWLDHGVRDELVLVMHRGTHGWKAAGQGHALLAHQLYVKNVEPLCATSHEVAVVGLSGGGWRTVWARSDDDVTHPAPPSAPVGVEDVVMAARNAENAIRNCAAAGQIGEGYVQYADDLRDAVQRLAQKPAGGQRSTHGVWRKGEWLPCYCAADSDHGIGNEQPAAVDEAMQRTKWRCGFCGGAYYLPSPSGRFCCEAQAKFRAAQPGGSENG